MVKLMIGGRQKSMKIHKYNDEYAIKNGVGGSTEFLIAILIGIIGGITPAILLGAGTIKFILALIIWVITILLCVYFIRRFGVINKSSMSVLIEDKDDLYYMMIAPNLRGSMFPKSFTTLLAGPSAIFTENKIDAEIEATGIAQDDETVKALFKNKYWVIVTVASFVVFFVIIMYAMGNVYYCQYVLYDMGQYSWVSNSISIAQFAVMFVTPAFMKKFGKTAVYEAGMVVMGLGFLGFAVFGGSSTIVMIICNVLKGCGVGMAGGMALGMVADTITYGTKKTGIDTVGLGNAGVSAAQKIGLGLGTAVFGWVLNGAGYDGSLDAQGIAQPESVSTAINFLYNWLPFIMVIAIFVLMVILYHCERDLKKMEAAE